MKNLLPLLFLFLTLPQWLAAQCGSTINAFPYLEDFENGPGGWVSGGTNNDWVLCTPHKTTISTAGSGTRCWVVGDSANNNTVIFGHTTGSPFYKKDERSYVKSPCFDFTNLQYPFISFKIFWESERKYDGTNLQYSINGGTTWQLVGAYGDPVNCLNQNWYDTSAITYLDNTISPSPQGWCGNIQPGYVNATGTSCLGGKGSNGWKSAKHCMPYLAGQASVMFRFTFGAGTTCNDYDGMAFDSVSVGDAPPNTANFTAACPVGSSVSFSGIVTMCPTSLTWDFGDVSSASNTAAGLNASHTFSGPGTYTVAFTTSGPCNAPATFTKQITIGVPTFGSIPVKCFGNADGKGFVTLPLQGGPYSFSWNTVPAQHTDTAGNLGAGTYSVTVSNAGGCNTIDSVTITQPQLLTVTPTVTNPSCGQSNGAINLTPNNGTPNYIYHWGNGSNTSSLTNIPAGSYSFSVTDANGCTFDSSVTINTGNGTSVAINGVNHTCAGGSTTLTAVPGTTGTYTYQWSNGQTTAAISVTPGVTTVFSVVLTPASGCTSTSSVTVTVGLPVTVSVSNASVCPGNSVNVIATASGIGTYHWNTGQNTDTINVSPLVATTYNVTFTDSAGCTAMDSGTVTPFNAPAVNAGADQTSCSGKSVSLTATGGVAYHWNTGATTATITVSDTATTAYSVTVTDGNGCTATDSAKHLVNSNATFAAASTDVTCFGHKNGTIKVNNPALSYSLNGSPFIMDTAYGNLLPGNYTIIGKDAAGCLDTVKGIAINQPGALDVIVTPDSTVLVRGNEVILESAVQGGTAPFNYVWLPNEGLNCTNCASPVAAPQDTVKYLLQVTDANGCKDSTTDVIYVVQPFYLIYPNAFTPNKDGRNDIFRPVLNGPVDSYLLRVYNRWGDLMFESGKITLGWDGTYKGDNVPMEVYVWYVEYTPAGTQKSIKKQGNVTLIR